MSKYIQHIDIQNLVDNYRTLSIVIKRRSDNLVYETEIYNKGVKLFIGKDSLLILSFARALCAIIKFIDEKKINKHTELSSQEITRWLDISNEIKNDDEVIGVFISSHVKNLLE